MKLVKTTLSILFIRLLSQGIFALKHVKTFSILFKTGDLCIEACKNISCYCLFYKASITEQFTANHLGRRAPKQFAANRLGRHVLKQFAANRLGRHAPKQSNRTPLCQL